MSGDGEASIVANGKKIDTILPEPTKDPVKDRAGLQKLFAQFEELDKKHQEAQRQADKQAKAKSAVVRQIADYGRTFVRNGRQLTVMRKNESFYFRGPGEATGIEV